MRDNQTKKLVATESDTYHKRLIKEAEEKEIHIAEVILSRNNKQR